MHSSSNDSWIIDSGATDHICSYVKWFHSHKKIIPITVRLPNGQCLVANHSGTIHFSPDFIVHNVLLLPEFSLNLLSFQSCVNPLITMSISLNHNVSYMTNSL